MASTRQNNDLVKAAGICAILTAALLLLASILIGISGVEETPDRAEAFLRTAPNNAAYLV